MKVFLRTLVVLLAALIVVGSTLAISSLRSTSIGSTGSNTSATQIAGNRPQRPTGEEIEGGERGGAGFNLMGLGSVGLSLGEVSLIVTPFAIAANLQQRRKKNKPMVA